MELLRANLRRYTKQDLVKLELNQASFACRPAQVSLVDIVQEGAIREELVGHADERVCILGPPEAVDIELEYLIIVEVLLSNDLQLLCLFRLGPRPELYNAHVFIIDSGLSMPNTDYVGVRQALDGWAELFCSAISVPHRVKLFLIVELHQD